MSKSHYFVEYEDSRERHYLKAGDIDEAIAEAENLDHVEFGQIVDIYELDHHGDVREVAEGVDVLGFSAEDE